MGGDDLDNDDDAASRAPQDARPDVAPWLRGERARLLAMLTAAERARGAAERERDAALLRLYSTDHERRRRIARDLHDHVGQHAALLLLGLRRLSREALPDAAAQEVFSLIGHVESLGAATRRLTAELRSSPVEAAGLAPALRLHVEAWSQKTRIAAEFHDVGEPYPVTPAVAEAMFMAVQEGLTNIARHAAGASHATVVLTYTPSRLTLAVEDDGAGVAKGALDAATLEAAHRFGIAGMRERFRLAGGTLECDSAPGRGFAVIGRVAIARAEA